MAPAGWEVPAAAVLAGVLLGVPATAGAATWIRCLLADERIDESSGIASSSSTDDVVFTHNDSGDRPRFFAVDTRTCATRAIFTVAGAGNLDWEDMAAGVGDDGTPVLWLADIGDNRASRRSVTVYEVAEPAPDAPEGTVPVRGRGSFTYPDGAHDAETLLIDPETGRPVILTKDLEAGRSRAYRLPPNRSGSLELLAEVDLRALPGGGLSSPAWALTGGATSPDRRSLVLRTYFAGWRWTTSPGEPLATTLARPPEPLTLPLGRQAEAVTFTRDGTALWVTSEGTNSPLGRIPFRSPPIPTAPNPTPAPGPAPTTPAGRNLGPIALGTLAAGGAALVLGISIVRLRRPR